MSEVTYFSCHFMKSLQFNTYGGIEVLTLYTDVPKPSPAKNQVLVEVYSASINPVDWKIRAGFFSGMIPLQLPVTIGGNFAGVVVELGADVSDFKVGDEVYGQAIVLNGGSGSTAEFAAVNADNTALKPKTTDFVESSALPLVGTSAMQALKIHMNLQKDQKILIHGGAGGIGTTAIQVAKSIGAYVATTVSTDDKDFVKGLGADEVIDYKTEKFEELLKDFDAVFDTAGGDTTSKSFLVLKRGGVLVSMAGTPDEELAQKYGVTAIGQNTVSTKERLDHLTELVDNGAIKIQIDKVFPFDQAIEAYKYQENDHTRGKVVIKIKD